MLRVNSTKLLVEDIIETEKETKSGILLPTAVIRKNHMKGTILLKGDGTPDIPIVHEIGDIALYHPAAGSKFTWEEREVRLVDVADIFLSGIA